MAANESVSAVDTTQWSILHMHTTLAHIEYCSFMHRLHVRMIRLARNMDRSDSRIPDSSFGTAEEDALRRDFTLNALFYNVNEGKVEDMTGR